MSHISTYSLNLANEKDVMGALEIMEKESEGALKLIKAEEGKPAVFRYYGSSTHTSNFAAMVMTKSEGNKAPYGFGVSREGDQFSIKMDSMGPGSNIFREALGDNNSRLAALYGQAAITRVARRKRMAVKVVRKEGKRVITVTA